MRGEESPRKRYQGHAVEPWKRPHSEVRMLNVRAGGFREKSQTERLPVKLATLSVLRRSPEGDTKLAPLLAARSFCETF